MATTVIHINDAPEGWQSNPQYVYIGRKNGARKLKASKWANPYTVHEFGRAEAVMLFEGHLFNSDELIAALPELIGKTLVCWCKKRGANIPCHGDVLARYVALLEEGH